MTTHSIQFNQKPAHRPGPLHSLTMRHTKQFGSHLATVKPAPSADPQHEELTKQAEKLVAQTFYGELLKQMRNSPFKSKIFSGGRGGEAFGQMFDQKMAEKMATGSGKKLVDAIVHRIEANRAYGGGPTKLFNHKTKRPAPTPTMRLNQMGGMR